MSDLLVANIGGSTLGRQATTLADRGATRRRGAGPGGGDGGGRRGADGGMRQCRPPDEDIGFVREIIAVDPGPLVRVLLAGAIPVIAPVGLLFKDERPTGQLLNTNADSAAG